MSAASRLEKADRCFVARDPHTGRFVKTSIDTAKVNAAAPSWPSLALNSAGIAGGLGFELPTPVVVAGIEWSPDDGGAFASPIGVALAAEMAGVS